MEAPVTGPVIIPLISVAFFLFSPIASGCILAWRLRGIFYVGERILLGTIFGLTGLTALSFLFSLAFGFSRTVLVTTTLLIAVFGAYVQKSRPGFSNGDNRPLLRSLSKIDIRGLIVFTVSLVVFTFLMKRLILWQNGGLYTGYADAWGDLPLHLGLTMSFAANSELLLGSVILAGEPLTYPFLSDFFSAMLMQFRLPLEQAIEWPAILLNSIAVTLLFYLSKRLVRNRVAAVFVPVIFLLAGGFGFFWFLKDLYLAPRPILEFLQNLPQGYTNISDLNIRWVNPTLAHLIPQRSFLFGLPIALSVILLWWNAFNRRRPRQPWVAGLFVGALPLFHTHTFMTLTMVASYFLLLSLISKRSGPAQRRYWFIFWLTALPLALPQLVYLLSSKVSLGAIRFQTGWLAGSENLTWFWLKNLGLFIPLLLLSGLCRKWLDIPRRALMFYIPFGLLFSVCNLFLLAPFAYDNNKVLIYWFLLSLPFVARLLTKFYQSRSWWLSGFAFRLLFVSLTFSGGLNLIREFQNEGWEELRAEEVALAGEIKKSTGHGATFLSAPIHNNLLTLAGRAVVLGYPGHVYSHGLDYIPIEKAINEIYLGKASAHDNLREFDVDYIVVGPHERQRYGEEVNWLEAHYQEFMKSENYVLYEAVGKNPSVTGVSRRKGKEQ